MKKILVSVFVLGLTQSSYADVQLSCRIVGKNAPKIKLEYLNNHHTNGPKVQINPGEELGEVYYSEQDGSITFGGIANKHSSMYVRHSVTVEPTASPKYYVGKYRTGYGWCGTGDAIYEVKCTVIPPCR